MTLTTTRSNMSVVGSISRQGGLTNPGRPSPEVPGIANAGTLACRHVLAVINHSAERPSAHATGRAMA